MSRHGCIGHTAFCGRLRCNVASFPLFLHTQRYMHMQCLQHWQAQLRATKGVAAARRCDVCKERWAKCYQPPAVPTDWRTMLRDLFRSVPWPAVLEVRGARGAWAGMLGMVAAWSALLRGSCEPAVVLQSLQSLARLWQWAAASVAPALRELGPKF